MLLVKIRNISFRAKMTALFAIVCMFSVSVSGMIYYRFAEKEIEHNFTQNAESLTEQMKNTLDTRLGVIRRTVFSALTNRAFTQPLGEYFDFSGGCSEFEVLRVTDLICIGDVRRRIFISVAAVFAEGLIIRKFTVFLP